LKKKGRNGRGGELDGAGARMAGERIRNEFTDV